MSRRTDRINEQLREEISMLLTRSIKDPRLNAVISITRVVSSSDLRSARVYISVMGNQEQRSASSAMRAMGNAAPNCTRHSTSGSSIDLIAPIISCSLTCE